MINPNLCYKSLGMSTHILPYFQKYKEELEYINLEGFSWTHMIPLELILEEPILKVVHATHKIAGGGIFRIAPNRSYKWHQDIVRGIAINMLLEHEESFVLFGNDVSDFEDQFEIVRLESKIGELYLFNTQCMHSVINFSGYRYLFTLNFEEDKSTLRYENFFRKRDA